jgi:hypothetical protein
MHCCFCHRVPTSPDNATGAGCTNWARDPMTIAWTEVALEEGDRRAFPGMTTTFVRVCPACFRTRLLAWLASQGVTPEVDQIRY